MSVKILMWETRSETGHHFILICLCLEVQASLPHTPSQLPFDTHCVLMYTHNHECSEGADSLWYLITGVRQPQQGAWKEKTECRVDDSTERFLERVIISSRKVTNQCDSVGLKRKLKSRVNTFTDSMNKISSALPIGSVQNTFVIRLLAAVDLQTCTCWPASPPSVAPTWDSSKEKKRKEKKNSELRWIKPNTSRHWFVEDLHVSWLSC